MAILAGIDEAGLGPLLGPLVVSGAAFRGLDDLPDLCLWDVLRDSCASSPARSQRRVVVADSKQLYRPRGSLAPLERTALVMLAAAGLRPASWRELLEQIAPGACEPLAHYPWYRDRDIPLPLSAEVGDIATKANAVRRDCRTHGIAFHGVFVEPLTAGAFNRMVHNTRNKSVVSLGLTLRVVDRLMRSAPNERVRLCLDRHGGRTHYREPLMTAWPTSTLEILEESPTRSAYRLVQSSRVVEIEFVTGGEARYFPTALASVYSKYVRELYMHAFNAFWSDISPDLRPTAGYYTDARRWLCDADEELRRRSIDRNTLIRQR